MDLSFENHAYNKLFGKTGLTDSGTKGQIFKVLVPLAICWLPLAIIALINQTFWTGNAATSFITSFDTQARLLVAMPIFIIAEKLISQRLTLILQQFVNSGIIRKEEQENFLSIVKKNTNFLRSNWTDFAVIVISITHVLAAQSFEIHSHRALLTWQVTNTGEDASLSLAGWWNTLISRPFVMFLFYRWLLRIVVWGRLLFKISKLQLVLFPPHPDQAGGMGFIGYSLRYFSPLAFAISATVAGNMADLITIEGAHVLDFKYAALALLGMITLLFTAPLFSFTTQLIKARERNIFENYDVLNGFFRELGASWSKGFNDVKPEDLSRPDFSTVTDFSSVMNSALQMKTMPFTLKDLIPLWVMTALPLLPVIAMEIPLVDLLKMLIGMMV